MIRGATVLGYPNTLLKVRMCGTVRNATNQSPRAHLTQILTIIQRRKYLGANANATIHNENILPGWEIRRPYYIIQLKH